jgi:homoserine dehydrogenase
MTLEGTAYDEVLAEAQRLGYAERDPSADVGGYDTCRKIAILVSLTLGKQVDFQDISTEGITEIEPTDIEYARKMGGVIKLLAVARIGKEGAYARVSPCIVFNSNPLYSINDVNNAIFIKGNVIGGVMFSGPGAGKLPTASAVVTDVVDAVKHQGTNIIHYWSSEKHDVLSINDTESNMLVRVKCDDKKDISTLFDTEKYTTEFVTLPNTDDEFAFITGMLKENAINDKLNKLSAKHTIIKKIRVEI